MFQKLFGVAWQVPLALFALSALVTVNAQAQSDGWRVTESKVVGSKVYLDLDLRLLEDQLEILHNSVSGASSSTWGGVLTNGGNPGMDVNFSGYDALGIEDVTATGTITADSLVLNKDASITGRLNVTNVVTLNDSLKVSGFVEFGDSLEVVKAVTIGETLYVTGVTSLGDSLHAVGNVDFDALFNVDGAATFGSTLTVTGETTLNDSLHVNSGANIMGTLYADSISVTDVINGQVSSLANHDTDDLSEGSTNLYFTDARARAAISEGTGVTITNGQIAIGQAVSTTSDVTFDELYADSLQASGTLTVTGVTTLNDSLHVDLGAGFGDDIWVAGNSDVTGNSQVDGTLNVDGTTNLDSTYVAEFFNAEVAEAIIDADDALVLYSDSLLYEGAPYRLSESILSADASIVDVDAAGLAVDASVVDASLAVAKVDLNAVQLSGSLLGNGSFSGIADIDVVTGIEVLNILGDINSAIGENDIEDALGIIGGFLSSSQWIGSGDISIIDALPIIAMLEAQVFGTDSDEFFNFVDSFLPGEDPEDLFMDLIYDAVSGDLEIGGAGSFLVDNLDNAFLGGMFADSLIFVGSNAGLLIESEMHLYADSLIAAAPTNITQTLEVDGITTLNDSLHVTSGANISATLYADSISTPGLNVTENFTFSDGTQGAGKVLTSDANGHAYWATASGGGATYTAGTGIDLTSNVISIGQAVGTTDDVTFNELEVDSDAAVFGNLDVTGEASISSDLYADSWSYLTDVDVSGDATIYGDLWADSDALVNGNLEVEGQVDFYGDLYADYTSYLTDVDVSGYFDVSGDATFYGDLYADYTSYLTDVDVSGYLDVLDDATIYGDLYADSDALVNGNLEVEGQVDFYGDLYVEYISYLTDVEVDGYLEVYDDASIYGDLNAEYLYSESLYADSYSYLAGVEVDGDLDAFGDATIDGDLYVDSYSYLTDVDVSDRLDVEGEATFTGGVYIEDGNQGEGKILTSDVNGKASWSDAPLGFNHYEAWIDHESIVTGVTASTTSAHMYLDSTSTQSHDPESFFGLSAGQITVSSPGYYEIEGYVFGTRSTTGSGFVTASVQVGTTTLPQCTAIEEWNSAVSSSVRTNCRVLVYPGQDIQLSIIEQSYGTSNISDAGIVIRKVGTALNPD